MFLTLRFVQNFREVCILYILQKEIINYKIQIPFNRGINCKLIVATEEALIMVRALNQIHA